MIYLRGYMQNVVLFVLLMSLSACSGGGADTTPVSKTYTISGFVTDMHGMTVTVTAAGAITTSVVTKTNGDFSIL